MLELLRQPWPWYVAGPLVGLMPALLLVLGNKLFGISSNLRHACAAVLPGGVACFRYDWKTRGFRFPAQHRRIESSRRADARPFHPLQADGR